jgi:hypothetical protein
VYVYLDPRKPGDYNYQIGDELLHFDYEPFYIGKGKNNRHTSHLTEAQNYIRLNTIFKGANKFKIKKLSRILLENKTPVIMKVKENLDESHAYLLEYLLIRTIGRKGTTSGPLTNLTDGGEGIRQLDEISRKHIGDCKRGKTWEEMYGTKEAFYLRMRIKKTKALPENRELMMKHARERGDNAIGTHRSESTKKKLSAQKMGNKNPAYGIKVSNPLLLLDIYFEEPLWNLNSIHAFYCLLTDSEDTCVSAANFFRTNGIPLLGRNLKIQFIHEHKNNRKDLYKKALTLCNGDLYFGEIYYNEIIKSGGYENKNHTKIYV